MSHEIEKDGTLMVARQPAWHGLGKVLELEPTNAADAIREAGLDWDVALYPIFIQTTEGLKQVNGKFRAVVRDKDFKTLGVVGKNYHPVQNLEAFSFMDEAAGDGLIEYHSAGSLKGGKWVWVLAKIPGLLEILPGDNVDKYLLLYQSHDGSMAVRIGLTPIRVVCWNTLSAASRKMDNGGDRIATIRHTMNANQLLKDTALAIREADVAFQEAAEGWRFLTKKPISAGQLNDYINSIFPFPTPSNDGTVPKDAFKALRERIKVLHESGAGSDIPGVRGTLWGAYNAVTEIIDHERGSNRDVRLRSAWFGNGAKVKDQALQVALAMAN